MIQVNPNNVSASVNATPAERAELVSGLKAKLGIMPGNELQSDNKLLTFIGIAIILYLLAK